MTGQRVSPKGLSFLTSGLQATSSLKKLFLQRNGICSIENITSLCYALQANNSIEVLDLSENNIGDEAAEGLKELLKGNEVLLDVNLEHNLIAKTCFAVSLCENNTLTHFSVSFNPLSFENFITILEMLNINTSLRYLGVKGMKFAGPAKIKENQSGVLLKQEALLLKLANVLRHSSICSIGIDLDPSAELQLRELETTLLKHNTFLVNIFSDSINWRASLHGPLLGIQKALRANSWLKQNENDSDEEVPTDLESIVALKKFNGKDLRGKKEFSMDSDYLAPQYFSAESPLFSSPNTYSPDFSNSTPKVSEKPKRISRQNSEKTKNYDFEENILKVFENFNVKMQCFQEEISGQVNSLYERIQDIEMSIEKNLEYKDLIQRVAELEKKDESNQKMIMLANREISELKAKFIPELNKSISGLDEKFDSRWTNFEKKVLDQSSEIPLIKKHLEDLDLKIFHLHEGSSGNSEIETTEKNFHPKYLDSPLVPKRPKKVVMESIPGSAESLVLRAIQEKNYWNVRKKLDFSRDPSPKPQVQEFFSSSKCPSKDLHEKLMQKGLNFVSRSASCKHN